METQVEKLMRRLKEMDVKQFSVFKGKDWYNTSSEDRAKTINDVFDAIESGDVMVVPDGHLDGPPWFPLPQINSEQLKGSWAYRKYRMATWLHKLAYKFDRWYLWRQHKKRNR